MTRAAALLIALVLTGIPATLACARLCTPAVSADAGACHDHTSAPAGPGIAAEAGDCIELVAGTPFLVEATAGSVIGPAAQPAVIAPVLGSAAADLTDDAVVRTGPANLPPPARFRSVVLRI